MTNARDLSHAAPGIYKTARYLNIPHLSYFDLHKSTMHCTRAFSSSRMRSSRVSRRAAGSGSQSPGGTCCRPVLARPGWPRAGPGPALPLPRARGSRSPLLGWTFAGRLSPSSLRRSAHRDFQRSISESRKTKRNRKYVTPVSKHAGAGDSALKEPAAPGCPPHTRRHADVVP